MSDAIFNLKLLDKYQLISEPGTHIVKVAATVTKDFLIEDREEPSKSRYLVPLRVISAENLGALLAIVPNETTTIPFNKVAHLFMKGVLWAHELPDIDSLPIKGEDVIATFDYVDNKLLCTNLELISRNKLQYLNINDISGFRKLLANILKHK